MEIEWGCTVFAYINDYTLANIRPLVTCHGMRDGETGASTMRLHTLAVSTSNERIARSVIKPFEVMAICNIDASLIWLLAAWPFLHSRDSVGKARPHVVGEQAHPCIDGLVFEKKT